MSSIVSSRLQQQDEPQMEHQRVQQQDEQQSEQQVTAVYGQHSEHKGEGSEAADEAAAGERVKT
jgi:hypothetical protein